MKAMILAAGLGTRLKPLTAAMPKALVPVAGKPMLEGLLARLRQQGIHEIIINVHHFAGQVIQFLRGKEDFGLSIAVSDETGELLNTGGGLMKAAWFFNDGEPFLLHNVDVLSDIDFSDMENALRQGSSLATLAVAQRESSRYFLFDGNSRLAGWENIKTGERIVHSEDSHLEPLAFSGVHLISPEIFSLVQRKGKFSMVEVYLALCAEHKITAYRHDPDSWLDMGKPGDLEKAGALLRKLNLPTL